MTQFDERREPLQEEDGGRLEDSFSISSEENNRNRTLRRRDALECLVRERKEGERRARQAGLHEHAQVIDSSSMMIRLETRSRLILLLVRVQIHGRMRRRRKAFFCSIVSKR